jgi:rod shape-determining protein MreC
MRSVKHAAFVILFFASIAFVSSHFPNFYPSIEARFAAASRPLLSAVNHSSAWVGTGFKAMRWMREETAIRHEIEMLRAKAVHMNELQAENQRLTSLLDFRRRAVPDMRRAIACRVIGRSPAAWQDAIVLSKGYQEGVRLEAPIVTPAGLAGRVVQTLPMVSKARLITSPDFRIGGLIQRTRLTGVVYGTPEGECRMKYIPLEADVKPGDAVETAGLTPGVPKGILIGRIAQVWKEPGQIYKVALIRLFADLERLEEVLVVPS